MSQWWKNVQEMSTDDLTDKMRDCTRRAIGHDEEDRPILARAARSKATIAGEELNRRLHFEV
jgi:hypothetical protein